MPVQTYLFPCLKDNFGVLLHDPDSGVTASIDAPEAAPVEAALQKTGWGISQILVTHPRAAGPTVRPHFLFFPGRQARLCRRHFVLDRLRSCHRGHAGDDVALAPEI